MCLRAHGRVHMCVDVGGRVLLYECVHTCVCVCIYMYAFPHVHTLACLLRRPRDDLPAPPPVTMCAPGTQILVSNTIPH